MSLSWRKRAVYASMVGLALLAASMDHSMQQHALEMKLTVQQALRLSMIRLLEAAEYTAAQDAYHAATSQAQEYGKAAEEYQGQAARDAFYGSRQRQRGEYLQRLGDMQAREAALHAAIAREDDAERLALLHNITILKKDENKTLQELNEIHQGACGWMVVKSFCSTVGGATALQERAQADYVEIHNDWKQAEQLGRAELMQGMVADMLTAKSARYNESAEDLKEIADQWDAQSQQDYEIAKADNETAAKLWKKASRDYAIMQRDETVEYKVDVLVERLMQRAESERLSAYWAAVLTILCAAAALLFFGARIVPKTHAAVQSWQVESHDAVTSLAYIGIHLLIFLGVVGLTGSYFVNMEQYTSIQRAVILLWFSTLGSVMQTVALHALPWAWQELFSSNRENSPIRPFLIEICTRYVVFFAMFLLEIVVFWLALGHGLFQETWVNLLSSWIFRLLVAGAVGAYGYWVEFPRRQDTTARDDFSNLAGNSSVPWPENESILLSADSASHAPSEATPLRKADLMSWGTTLDMAIDGSEGHSSRQASVAASSLFRALWHDLLQLMLPLEILFVACMVAVLRNAVHMVWISHATWIQCGVLMCALGVVLLAFWLAREAAYCGESTLWARKTTDHELMDAPTSLRMPPKFEMVQV